MLGDVDGIALSVTPFRQVEVAAAPRLQVVARTGVGFDAVEVPALTARGIPLMVTGTANSTSVAEQAVFFMMALAKRGTEMNRRMQQGVWHDRKGGLPVELSGKTVLIVGFGRIGSRTAPRCAAFGMRVLVYDPYKSAQAIRAAGCEPAEDFDAALAQADFVSIHCPKNPETTGMFGAARLARMRAGAYLVNTARGGIIDEPALYSALQSGHIAGAGLDVFEIEPPTAVDPLLHLENVIAAPHMAGVTNEFGRGDGGHHRQQHAERTRRHADPGQRGQPGGARTRLSGPVEIIDAQVHLNHVGFEACVGAMDAVGIDAAIIDVFPPSGHRLPNGALRCDYASAEDAVRRTPARFAYVARLDPADPELARLMAEVRARPGCVGIRVDQPPRAEFAEGGYAAFFGLAERHRLPTWIVLPGRLHELAPYAEAFPDLPFVVDHAGMPENWNRIDPQRFAPLDALLGLARFPNVAVKWGHMTRMSARPFPYDDVLAQLRRAVDAFGAPRIMWESDWTQCMGHETLAEMLFSIRLSPLFSDEEKSHLLGRTARTVMRWDRPDDRVQVVAVADADWDAFAQAFAAQGRLANGGVRVIRVAPDAVPILPAGARCVGTADLPGVECVGVAAAAAAAVSGRANVVPKG